MRSLHNRKLPANGKRLWNDIAAQEIAGYYEVDVPAAPGRKARVAKMQVQFATRQLQVPPKRPEGEDYNEPVTVTAILAIEVNPPSNVQPLVWKLISTRGVKDFADARKCVQIYSARWFIETFFKTLKSECRTLHRQLKTIERLKKAVVVDSIISYFILYMTNFGRQHPETPCTNVFENHQWKLILLCADRTAKLPKTPPSIGEILVCLGKIGGHLQRNSDGPVGAKILRRALEKVVQFAAGFYTCAEAFKIDIDRRFA